VILKNDMGQMAAPTNYTLIHPFFEVSLHPFEHIDGNVFDSLANFIQGVT